MNKKGYESTTIRDICEALEITASYFDYYFAKTTSKETLPAFLSALDLYISGTWLRYHRDGVEAAESKVRKSWRAIQPMIE